MKNGRTEKLFYTFKIRTLCSGVGHNHTNTIYIIPPQLLYFDSKKPKMPISNQVTEISFMNKN